MRNFQLRFARARCSEEGCATVLHVRCLWESMSSPLRRRVTWNRGNTSKQRHCTKRFSLTLTRRWTILQMVNDSAYGHIHICICVAEWRWNSISPCLNHLHNKFKKSPCNKWLVTWIWFTSRCLSDNTWLVMCLFLTVCPSRRGQTYLDAGGREGGKCEHFVYNSSQVRFFFLVSFFGWDKNSS